MKLLKEILYGTRIQDILGNTHVAIEDLAFDSRKVKAFSLFVAIPGVSVDGHDFIEQAAAQGATAIVCERLPRATRRAHHLRPGHGRADCIGQHRFEVLRRPQCLDEGGRGGAQPKTTTVSLLHRLFRSMDRRAGMLSTVENRVLDEVVPASHTTPDALQMQQLFRRMADAGCKYVFMEASSHSIHQHRLAGTKLAGAVFTNITHDHLDYHGDFNAYIQAKKASLTWSVRTLLPSTTKTIRTVPTWYWIARGASKTTP